MFFPFTPDKDQMKGWVRDWPWELVCLCKGPWVQPWIINHVRTTEESGFCTAAVFYTRRGNQLKENIQEMQRVWNLFFSSNNAHYLTSVHFCFEMSIRIVFCLSYHNSPLSPSPSTGCPSPLPRRSAVGLLLRSSGRHRYPLDWLGQHSPRWSRGIPRREARRVSCGQAILQSLEASRSCPL